MRTVFFLRDLRNVREQKLRNRIAASIENVEEADGPDQIAQFKRLKGSAGYARIRVGNWRLGVIVRGDSLTFVRCLHRREVYRYFP